MWARDFVVVSKGRNKEAGEGTLQLASVNHFRGLWNIGGTPKLSGNWPWGDQDIGGSDLQYKSVLKEVAGGVGFGLVGFHMKGMTIYYLQELANSAMRQFSQGQ